jgi:transcriptional regulator with XRE-family HTH domain
MSREQFGAMVRAARKRQGMSQGALATALGVSGAFLHDVEYGRRSIKSERWEKLAALLHVPVHELATLSGKLDQGTLEYLQAQPLAMRMVRRMAELNVHGDDLRELSTTVDEMHRFCRKAFGTAVCPNGHPMGPYDADCDHDCIGK